jgi:hypothetical protein
MIEGGVEPHGHSYNMKVSLSMTLGFMHSENPWRPDGIRTPVQTQNPKHHQRNKKAPGFVPGAFEIYGPEAFNSEHFVLDREN